MSTSLIPVAVLTAVVFNEGAKIATGHPPTMKPVIGGFALGVGLYALDGVSDQLASAFCVLIIVGSLLMNGPAVTKKIGGFLS